MGNLCSIFHSRFKNLIKVIPSTRKAQLVDYILLGWQTSSYRLKGSDQKWFMKPYAQIVVDTGIPQSTLERYIKELDDEGFIERRQALYSRTKEQGEFEVKKGAYIYITEKLLSLLNPAENSSEDTQQREEKNIHINTSEFFKKSHIEVEDKQSDSIIFDKSEGFEPLKMRGLYISDLYTSKNNIIFKKLSSSVDNETLERLNKQFEVIHKLLYTEIKEEIPDEVKKLILGTFFNLTFENRKEFSSPKQLVAEYLFALLNIDFYLPKVTCFKHRNNILSKMVRMNLWRTPKGFYQHFYLGQSFKDKQELREQRWQQEKDREINLIDNINDIKDKRLIQIESQMYEKSCLINKLTQSIYQQSKEEVIFKIQNQIQDTRLELEYLWHQQTIIEQECEELNYRSDTKRCA
jgi:hypothetical protein